MLESEFKASYLFVRGLSELIAERGLDNAVQTIGISRQAGQYINELAFSETILFCSQLEKRQAVELDINYSQIIQLAELVTDITLMQFDKLKCSSNDWLKAMPIETISYRQLLVDTFISNVSAEMFDVEHCPSRTLNINTPTRLFKALQDMSNLRFSVFVRLLIQRNLIQVKVFKDAVDIAVASFMPAQKVRHSTWGLVKAGADIEFIEKYSNQKYVDSKYYHHCRRLCEDAYSSKEVDSKAVFGLFESLMAEHKDDVRVYMELHNQLGVRIDTLHECVQQVLVQRYSHDDYHLEKEVARLINQ